MAKRRKREFGVSLFPFLSVLVCIIGTLSLLIVATTIGGTMAPDEETSTEVSEEQVEQADLEGQIATYQAQIQVDRERLRRLLEELRQITSLERVIRLTTEKVESATTQRASLEKSLSALFAKILKKRKKLKELHDAREPRPPEHTLTKIGVPGSIKGKSKYHPLFIDCRKNGVLILANGKLITTSSIANSSDITGILRNIKTSGNWCLFMLVRKDGIGSFDKLFTRARKVGIPYGFHPVYTKADFGVSDWEKPNWLGGRR